MGKGTTAKSKGVMLKENSSMIEEIWNGFRVVTVEAMLTTLCANITKQMTTELQESFINQLDRLMYQ